MLTCDVNVILAVYNRAHPDHAVAVELLDDARRSSDGVGVFDFVLASVIRLAINPSVMTAPSRLDDVLGFCRALREDDSATVLGHRPTAWAIFAQYCMLPHTSANTIPDAFLAACSRDAGLTLATFDRGFVKFPRLRWMQARTGQVFTNPR